MAAENNEKRTSTGIAGLDQILNGGLLSDNAYLIRGGPGTGKTTLGLHFLHQSVEADESALFISLSERVDKIKKNAERLGFDTERIEFLDLTPRSDFFTDNDSYTLFEESEVELNPLVEAITEKVEESDPDRVFLDSLTQFRYLSPSDYQFHKQALSFIHYLISRNCLLMFTSEKSVENPDSDLQFLSDGVINLHDLPDERYLTVSKNRGSDFESGEHSYRLTNQGMKVYPALVPERHDKEFESETLPFGIPEVDSMIHGGLERGTITLVTGPSGVGKTTLGMQFLKEAAGRGERSVLYLFDEKKEVLIQRCNAVGIPIEKMLETGSLEIIEMEPIQFTKNEFSMNVREQVENKDTEIIMVDSIMGYKLAVNEEELISAIHAINSYLRNMGVTVLLINEVENVTGTFKISEHGISFMADNVVFLRFLEYRGRIEKAIGVLKKRLSEFENRLRGFEITEYGIKVGEPLNRLRGILSGEPDFINNERDVLYNEEGAEDKMR